MIKTPSNFEAARALALPITSIVLVVVGIITLFSVSAYYPDLLGLSPEAE